jgi:hypothetical protein
MKMTWDALNSKTSSFRTLLETPDNEKGEIRDVVFSGLQAKLSEILKNRAPGAGKTLTIYADTLVMDVPSFNAAATVVVARCIDVTGLQGGIVKVPAPGPGDYSLSTFLIQESAGGSPVLVPSKAGTDGAATPLPVFGSATPQVVYYNVGSDGKSSLEIVEEKSLKAHLEDLLDKVWALNSLKASFTAATWLIDSGSSEDLSTARSMLTWVTACIRSWGANSGPISSDFVELYHSAAALLVTLIAEEGAYYVPVLASSYYSDHVKTLCDALGKYEIHLTSLNVQSGLQAVLQSVGSALEGATVDSIAPLQTELDQIDKNIDNLLGDIRILNRQFHSQQVESDRNLKVLTTKITQDAIFQQMMTTLTASFEIIMAVGSAGAALSTLSKNPAAKLLQGRKSLDYFQMTDILGNKVSPVPALKNAFEAVGNGVKGGLKIYSALTEEDATPDKELLNRALALMKMQEQSLAAFVTGALLVSGPAEGPESTLPEIGASDRADPNLAWDNFMIEAEVVLKPMESSESSEVKGALASFHGSLKVLAGYGKAINTKMVSAAAQMSMGTLVRARLQAAESTKERWASLQAKAKTDDEKLAALRGIVQVGLDGLKRSIFTAWTQYRNSFFYLNFQDPPRVINMDMDAAGLSKAFASVNAWIARLRGDTAGEKQVKLPDDDVTISFNLKIVKPDEAGGPATARLTPAAGNEPARIEWTIPAGDEQLIGVLPRKGNVAIWIKEAGFFLKGVTPNKKGNVVAKVSTSGSYENGFGPNERYRFDTKSLVGNYAYTATFAGGRIYNPWKIDAEVYATPTPFTQWTFVFDPDGGDPSSATELQMNLVVAYSERGLLTASAGQA